jgi:hypothetical protein
VGGGQFFPQVFDVRIDEIEIVRLVDVVSPYPFGERLFRNKTVGSVDEEEQYLILLTSERQEFSPT